MAGSRVRRGLTVCALGVALITVSVLVARHALTQVCAVSDHWFETSGGTWIYGRLYVPTPPPLAPVPGIVVAHGYMANLAMMELSVVRPLLQRGFVVLGLDRRGHGRSGGRLWPPPPPPHIRLQDFDPGLHAGVQFLRTLPAVDPTQVGLVGHSDGSRAVIMAACADWSIGATVAISPTLHPLDWVNDIVPKNLLLLYGTEERFQPAGDKDILFKRATDGRAASPGELVGSLTAGDARLLVTIPGAGHLTALFSPVAVRQTTEWLTQSFPAAPVRKAASPEQSPPYAWLIVGLAGAWLLVAGIIATLPGSPAEVAGFLAWHPSTGSGRAEKGDNDIVTTTAQFRLAETGFSNASTVSSAASAPAWLAAFWLVYRGALFELAVAAATRIAQMVDPMLAWVPLDGTHWFVTLLWGIFTGLCATTPFALVTTAQWRDAYGRLRSLGRRRCLHGIGLGILLGFAEMVAISAAITGWYEGFPSPAKLVALSILFPVLFAPLLGLEMWLRAVLPAGLAPSPRVERGVATLVLAFAICVFLSAGLPLWPGIVYVPYYLTAVELGVGVLLFATTSLCTRPFAGASALAVVATWVAVVACPLY